LVASPQLCKQGRACVEVVHKQFVVLPQLCKQGRACVEVVQTVYSPSPAL
jgi:hypothetical protein